MANQQQRGTSGHQRNPHCPAPPATPPPPHLGTSSTPDLGGHQSGGDEEISQETGTTKNRANWNHQKIVYLIELLKNHDVPRFRTNNAWSKEVWNRITAQFNHKFSSSYSMAQVKQKEQDIKKEYRVVKDLSGESGFGWDPDRKMVTSVDSVWESLESRRNKDALLRWRDKSFPYYDDLFALYDGRYAQGRSCRGMDHFASKTKQSAEAAPSYSPPLQVSESQMQSPSPTLPAPSASYLNFDVGEGPGRDDINWFGSDAFSPFPNVVNASLCPDSNEETLVPEQRPQETQRLNPLPFSSTPNVTDGKRPKKQKTSTNASTDNFHERFLILKKEEIDRFAAIEEKKMEDPYSIKNCVTTLEGLADRLQVEDVLKAADIFKDNTANREVFLSFRSDELRLGWLLKQI